VRNDNRPRREMAVFFIAFIVCAAVLGALMLKKYEDRRLQPAAPPQPQQEGVLLVTLFFASPEGDRLVREGREIDACDGPAECVEAVVEELINGPLGDLTPTLPAAATVHDVQVDGDLALVDLGEELAEGLPGGSSAELTAAYSIVNTIAVNFPGIKRVKLLLGGKEVETLKGHLDLREPLAPDFGLEKKP
jgi:sporulation and spore germination protein